MKVPAGFERLLVGHAVAVARSHFTISIRRALVGADGVRSSLLDFAARQPNARILQGRGNAYAVLLPHAPGRVVVRHNRHGGLFAPLTGDRFFAPTRAPHELAMSLALAERGVPTPEVVAFVLYPPGGILQRADVATREVTGGRDLAEIMVREGSPERAAAIAATARLVAVMSRAGARHADLNAKNILVTYETAFVLDIDRVTLGGSPTDVLDANLARLCRSLRKWRDQFGARISERDIADLEASSRRSAGGEA